MLSVAVHKNIAEYQPKIIGKLTLRTLCCVSGALGCSVAAALYMYFVLGLNPAQNTMVIYAVSLPFWCCGFLRPKGMTFERYLPLWFRASFGDNRVFYISSMQLSNVAKRAENEDKKGKSHGRSYRKRCRLKGIEAYSPRAGRVIV